MRAIYSTASLRSLERMALERAYYTESSLMARAGAGAWRVLKRRWPDAKRLAIFCGSGNNGGDGYVLARLAKEAGCEVIVYALDEPSTAVAAEAALLCRQSGVDIVKLDAPLLAQMSRICPPALENSDVVVDALLGIGLREETLPVSMRQVIQFLNHLSIPILTLDIPSGLLADTGWVDDTAVKAQVTVTFIGLKLGLLTGMAADYCGEIFVDDLDFPTDLFSQVTTHCHAFAFEDVQKFLTPRSRVAHKHVLGHVFVVGSDFGMGGAVRLSAEAALRVGAGLVSVFTRQPHCVAIHATRPELLCFESDALRAQLSKATTLVSGMGAGTGLWGRKLFKRLYKNRRRDQTWILDADALNVLAREKNVHLENSVLTPHPGEAARLLGQSARDIQRDRLQAIHALHRKYGGVIVLKGSGTLIHIEDKVFVCTDGNPGMASAGMGDVLSGILAGFIAQGISVDAATLLGVAVHARVADVLARDSGERGLLAMDVVQALRAWVNAC